jgi:hypothetical protein
MLQAGNVELCRRHEKVSRAYTVSLLISKKKKKKKGEKSVLGSSTPPEAFARCSA